MEGKCTIKFDNFTRKVQATISDIQFTKEDIRRSTRELYLETMSEVPRDTDTLANSCYEEIHETPFGIDGIVGYGGNGDPVNPKSGQHASQYMVKVHEDLSAFHKIGKAKYLEDPFNRRKVIVRTDLKSRIKGVLKKIWR